MFALSQKQQKIISIFLANKSLSSSAVHTEMVKLGEEASLVTIKRMLSGLTGKGFLAVSGSGRATVYTISASGRIFANVDAKKYCSLEPDKRYGLRQYNLELLAAFPAEIFSAPETKILKQATAEYQFRTKNLSATIRRKELERLVIELSWKSSKIEGNTYTLLDTEKLILENKVAPGKTKDETQMILNHKDAFNFIRENKEQFKALNRKNLEELHSIIIKKLNIERGLRKKPVGVIGSIYRPLDNSHQITDALEILIKKISQLSSPYAKAFVALLALAYIQPFEDGNKRTARLTANAILLAHNLAPLSYRSIDENDYREAMLTFYELNSILPLKKIFVEQYDFAARNYAVK